MTRFDESDGFEANLKKFVDEAIEIDPEMGAIFTDAVGLLLMATDEASRKAARTAFNQEVINGLDSLAGEPDVTA